MYEEGDDDEGMLNLSSIYKIWARRVKQHFDLILSIEDRP